MRGFLAALLALVLVGCATNREALQPVDPAVAQRSVAQRSVAYRPVARRTKPTPPPATGPLPAQTLAHRLGLSYRDETSHVLLADELSRVRIWKDSNELSVGGQTVRLGDRTKRRGRSLIVPTTMVSYVQNKVGEQRSRCAPSPRRPRQRVVMPTCVPPRLPEPKPAVDVKRKPLHVAPPRGLPGADPSWTPRVCERKWRWIVLHHSDDRSGNLAKYDRIHRETNHWDECGYHFVIGNGSASGDGAVEVGSRWFKQKHGAHAKTADNRFNDFGVGICLVGDFESDGPPTKAQMDATVRLCRWLMAKYRIPLTDVVGHCDCKATACPGKFFPWAELRERLRAP